VTVFSTKGETDNYVNCGDLCFLHEEWDHLKTILANVPDVIVEKVEEA
jgi:hypothetical protein